MKLTPLKRGFILIAAYMVIAVFIIIIVGFSARSIGEQKVTSRERDSIQALWLAEAGLDNAIMQIPNSPLSGTLGQGAYLTQTTSIAPTRYLIVSKGGVPAADETNPGNTVRTIRAIVEKPANTADPSEITAAITANGAVDLRGSTQVNGDIDDFTEFDFEDIFGISKDGIKRNATNLYIDPANNITPVDDITWAEVPPSDEMIISDSNWQGSGILVVDGDLRITGGYFRGIIWVIGKLWVSGNPVIDGTIFVECGAEFDTTLTGNPTVSYDSDAIGDAFGHLPSDLPPYIVNWKED